MSANGAATISPASRCTSRRGSVREAGAGEVLVSRTVSDIVAGSGSGPRVAGRVRAEGRAAALGAVRGPALSGRDRPVHSRRMIPGPRPVLARADRLPAHRERARRRCSTGCTRATPAARSSCASRTPTSTRSTQEAIDQIQQVLQWLGLDWDEGPCPPEPSVRDVPRRGRPPGRVRCGVRVLLHRGRGQAAQRRSDRRPAARPATTAGAATSRRPHATRCAAAGRPRSIRFRTPDDGPQHVRRRRPRRGVGRLVDDLRLRDRPLERHARVLPRQRGRRHRHGHHARAARRGPHRLDAPRARAAPRARRRRTSPSTRTCR